MLVGIDWGKDSHRVVLLSTAGKIIASFSIPNNYEGYLKLLQQLRKSDAKVFFAIERRDLRLVDFLLAHGFKGFFVDPNALGSYRIRYKSAPVKSDELDAFILADMLRADRHNLVEIVMDNPFVRELKGLITDRDRLVNDEIRLVNRIKGCLLEYYPEALQFFDDPTCKVALDFWLAYPTLEQASQLTVEAVREFLAKHKWYKGRDKVARRIIRVVNGAVVPVLDDVVRVKSRLLVALVKQLQSLRLVLEDYNREIGRLVASNEEVRRYTTLPGAGPILGSGIYTLIAGGMKFDSVIGLRAYVGTAPVTFESGGYRGVHFRFACNKFYRNILHQLAFCSLKESSWANEYYWRKRREGKKHEHALRCLADLWVKIIFAMSRNKEPYDEQKHLASMARFWLNNNRPDILKG